MLGYDQPLFMLAFDHRGAGHMAMFDAAPDPTPEQRTVITGVKQLIADAFAHALTHGVDGATAGILVDEEFGGEIASTAREHGTTVAMPVEVAGLDHFQFEYGEDFASHLSAFDPTMAKVLVRFNPEGDAAKNRTSLEHLGRLSAWLGPRPMKFLLELIVPATPRQLDTAGGLEAYDTNIRPRLTREVMATMQGAGIEPDLWKIEGIDRKDDCQAIAEQAQRHGRDRVGCVVLSRGADEPTMHRWLRTAAGVPGFVGFAIGRTVWRAEVAGYLTGDLDHTNALERISTNYRRCVAAFVD